MPFIYFQNVSWNILISLFLFPIPTLPCLPKVSLSTFHAPIFFHYPVTPNSDSHTCLDYMWGHHSNTGHLTMAITLRNSSPSLIATNCYTYSWLSAWEGSSPFTLEFWRAGLCAICASRCSLCDFAIHLISCSDLHKRHKIQPIKMAKSHPEDSVPQHSLCPLVLTHLHFSLIATSVVFSEQVDKDISFMPEHL